MTCPFPSNWMKRDCIDLMAKGSADKGFGTSRGRNLNDDLEDNAAQSLPSQGDREDPVLLKPGQAWAQSQPDSSGLGDLIAQW